MNRIYRTLWSVATQSWQAVPETAKTAGKKSKSSAGGAIASFALSWVLTGGASAQAPPAINQLPTGGTVARGTATINQTATAQAAAMTVNQTSQRAVVNWNTFNIGSAASVNFVQPNAQAITLNRVNDSNPSQIFGRMTSNGQVVLTNANGIYFAPGSSVDVGAITATTHSITDDNFMSGKYVFERNGATGKIINEGNITAALAGYVALLAPEVQNAGVVVARAGTVAMAAGETITLNIDGAGSLAGITTTPSAIATLIENKHAVQAPDGQIILSAVALNKLQAGVIKNSGSLEANSLVSKGGKIYLEGDDITLSSTSKLEAKGATGGGTVLVGGDWQGIGDMRQATKVTMQAGAAIDASATDKGDGGKVVLWSDVHSADSLTNAHGSIKSNGGMNGGDGGKVETSGHYLNVDDSQVSTLATQGNSGQWLLDPYDITISTGTQTTGMGLSGGVYATNTNSSILNTTTLQNALANGNVEVSTLGGPGTPAQTGNITISNTITWGSAYTLKLTAAGEIQGAGSLTRNGTGAIIFNQAGNSSSTYSGVISGSGSVTKTGLGILQLQGLSTYTGQTIVSGGTLKIQRNANGTTASPIGFNSALTVESGATFDASIYAVQVGNLTGAGSVILGTNYASFKMGGGTSITDTSEFSGVMSGPTAWLSKIGLGTQILSGLNTYAGNTSVNSGTLTMGRSSDCTNGSLGASTGTITLGATGTDVGTLNLNGYSPAAGQSLVFNGGSLVNSSATDVNWTASKITGTSTASILSTGGGAINLISTSTNTADTLGSASSGSTRYAITVQGKVSLSGITVLTASSVQMTAGQNTEFKYSPSGSGSQILSAAFTGSGDLILSPTGASSVILLTGTSDYTGNFTVAKGVVQPNRDAAFGAASNSIVVKDGASLSLNYQGLIGTPITRNFTISGYGVDYGATKYGALNYAYAAGNSYYSGTINLNGASRFTESLYSFNVTGTLQTNGFDFIDANLPKLVLASNAVQGGGSKKTGFAFVGAYDATGNYSSTYGTAAVMGYQLFSDLAGTTITTLAQTPTETAAFNNLPTSTSSAGTYSNVSYLSGLKSSTSALFPASITRTWTVVKANLSISATPSLTGNVYNGQIFTGTYTLDALGNDASGITITGVATGTNAGTYTSALSASGNVLSNYNTPLITNANLVIDPKPIIISNNTVSTTYNATSTYATLVASAGYTSTALVGSDAISTVTQTASRNNVIVSGIAQSGTFTSTPSAVVLSTGNAGNYSFGYAPTTNTIAKANLSISAAPSLTGNVYNGQTYTGTYTLNALGNDASGITITGVATGTNAGTYTAALSASGNALSNYNTPLITNANLVIDPRPVTLTGQMNYSGFATLDTASTDTTLTPTNLIGNDSLTFGGTAALAAANAGTQAITGFSGLTLSNPNYTKTGASGSVTVVPTSTIDVTTLNSTDVAALIGGQLAGITGSQIGSFSNSQLQVFSAQQLASLSSSQLSGFNAAQIGNLSSAQLQGIRPAQVALLVTAQLAGLGADQLASFSTPQLKALSAAQINAIAAAQLSALSAAQISILTSNTTASLNYSQVFALSPTQVAAVHPDQLSRMTAAEIGSFTDAQLQALTPAQIFAISPTSFGALGAEQIMAMSSAQLKSLSPVQLASFTPLQVASLSPAELNNFDATQLAAIGIFPKQESNDKFEAAIPVMTAVAPDATRMSGIEIRALTAEQLNKIPSQQVANLKPAQLQALTTTQLSQLTPEQVDNLSPAQLAVMSSRQLQALPTAPVLTADATPRMGVLAVTILQSDITKPASVGMAFEQDADTVSLRFTSAPASVPTMSEKVVFSDKLVTFMVATPTGEMVEFEGSVVNNRMIILAPSAMAKRVARTEMSLVLAAAVTSLGKENRVILTKLDGVVLDLR
jgi:filamentous hemagglutinin family protein